MSCIYIMQITGKAVYSTVFTLLIHTVLFCSLLFYSVIAKVKCVIFVLHVSRKFSRHIWWYWRKCFNILLSSLFYSVLFSSILFCYILFCSALLCSGMFYSALFYYVLFCSILLCSIWFCTVLLCLVLLCYILFGYVLF